MKTLTKEQQDLFMSLLRTSGALDMAGVAARCHLSYLDDIIPAMQNDSKFFHEFQEYVQTIRAELFSAIMIAATGKPGKGKRAPNVAAARYMLSAIDSGLIYGPIREPMKKENSLRNSQRSDDERLTELKSGLALGGTKVVDDETF